MPTTTTLDRAATRQTLLHAFDFAQLQVKAILAEYPSDYYPMYTVNGKYGQDQKRWTHWCDGFFPGMMFIFAEATREALWLDRAATYSIPLEERQYDRSVHDLGFLFFSTHLRWKALGGPTDRIDPLLLQAGRTMAMRFQEKGQYLRSFVEPASLFIDIMMNVGTIFYAGLTSGDAHLLDIANRHCETTRRVLVRGDGSTAHEAMFDLNTGEVLRQSTHQGYRGDSCWSRGLAWSLYGFTRTYRQTQRVEYLETAMLNADYYLENTPASGVTPWDYDAPLTGPLARMQVDTSAAAIAASGLIDLAAVTPDPTKARAYADFALNSLVSLTDRYLGDKTDGFEGILNGGVYHIHKNLGIHEAVLFGEYFFVEAIHKALLLLDKAPEAPVKDTTAYPEDSLPTWAKAWADGPTEEELPGGGGRDDKMSRPVALVTGSSRGIGRGIAIELGRIGYSVVVNYAGNAQAAEECLELVREAGGEGVKVQGDISLADDRNSLVDATLDAFGKIDLLVNNAGVAPSVRADILDASEESFDRMVNINLKGPYFLTQRVAAEMIGQVQREGNATKAQRPQIVTITSVSVYTASVNRGDYCISKAGLGMMTALWAARLAEYGIGVYEIRPGVIATDMTGGVKEKYDKMIADGVWPIRRWGEPSDVGRAVAAIARGDFPYSTGEVFNVDGGFHLRTL